MRQRVMRRDWGRRQIRSMILAWLAVLMSSFSGLSREFLLAKEIEQIRDTQELDRRTQLYLKFAALRLATMQDRLKGIESKEGDPMEFYSPADLAYGLGRCLRAIESNIDEAVAYKRADPKGLVKALTLLKSFAEKSLPDLEEAGRVAIAKKDESLFKSVGVAAEITKAAIEGSTEGLKLYVKDNKDRKR